MKSRSFVPAALAVLAMVFAAVSVVPASHAQQAKGVVPEDDRDVPEGSQIPTSRIQETEEKVKAYKAQMREKSRLQQQEQQQETETSDPNGDQQ